MRIIPLPFGHITKAVRKYTSKGKIMNKENSTRDNRDNPSEQDMMVFKTPSSTYRFTPSWVEHDGLKDILVGLISDDLKNPEQQ